MISFHNNCQFFLQEIQTENDPDNSVKNLFIRLLPIDWGCCTLTCTGGPLGSSTWAHIPVQRGLWRGQHPTVTQGGCSCCQGLAAQSPSWLVHGIRIGHRHCHMHGEVLLRQCCGLHEGDKHTHIFTHKHTQNPRSGDESVGSVVVMASLTVNNPWGFALINVQKIIRQNSLKNCKT